MLQSRDYCQALTLHHAKHFNIIFGIKTQAFLNLSTPVLLRIWSVDLQAEYIGLKGFWEF